jgi:DNA processing protein
MEEEWLNRIALTKIPAMGPVRIRSLIDYFGSATAVFKSNRKEWLRVPNITELTCKELRKKQNHADAISEWKFVNDHQIKPLFLTDSDYPKRLLHCYDPPSLLYYKGVADLNHPRILSVIGTRNHTTYGKQVTEQLIAYLSNRNITIISGLAFGIDAVAHRHALQNGLPTVGVLAHGLDTLYPWQHTSLAKEMEKQGGLLTEFGKHTQPDKHNFPKRNRIVAGMSDATLVIETACKGGSMITAELAFEYNRELMAVPGKITDPANAGCLQLIKQNKAVIYTSPESLLELMGWNSTQPTSRQIRLFDDLLPEEKNLLQLLQGIASLSIDELYIKSGLPYSQLASLLLQMEMKQYILSLPGKRYALSG